MAGVRTALPQPLLLVLVLLLYYCDGVWYSLHCIVECTYCTFTVYNTYHWVCTG